MSPQGSVSCSDDGDIERNETKTWVRYHKIRLSIGNNLTLKQLVSLEQPKLRLSGRGLVVLYEYSV